MLLEFTSFGLSYITYHLMHTSRGVLLSHGLDSLQHLYSQPHLIVEHFNGLYTTEDIRFIICG